MDNLPNSERWTARSLRLTAFPIHAPDIESIPKWEETIGELPENSNRQPRAGILEESGNFGKGFLSLTFVPGRIDWNYLSVFPQEKMPEDFPNIGQAAEAIELFKPLIIKWLESCSPLNRLAFGAELFLPSENHKDGYNLLNNYLHAVKVDNNSRDFSYSINRPRFSESGMPSIEINRLSRWRATKMMLKAEGLDSDPIFAVSLTLDINTVLQDDIEIKRENFNKLLNELIAMAIEIVEKGDIP